MIRCGGEEYHFQKKAITGGGGGVERLISYATLAGGIKSCGNVGVGGVHIHHGIL